MSIDLFPTLIYLLFHSRSFSKVAPGVCFLCYIFDWLRVFKNVPVEWWHKVKYVLVFKLSFCNFYFIPCLKELQSFSRTFIRVAMYVGFTSIILNMIEKMLHAVVLRQRAYKGLGNIA